MFKHEEKWPCRRISNETDGRGTKYKIICTMVLERPNHSTVLAEINCMCNGAVKRYGLNRVGITELEENTQALRVLDLTSRNRYAQSPMIFTCCKR